MGGKILLLRVLFTALKSCLYSYLRGSFRRIGTSANTKSPLKSLKGDEVIENEDVYTGIILAELP